MSQYHEADHLRLPRQPLADDLARVGADSDPYGDLWERPEQTRQSSSSSSDAVPVFLPFPGNEKSYKRPPRQAVQQGKHFTQVQTWKIYFSLDSPYILFAAPTFTVKSGEPFTMPLQKLGGKEYYIGIFFKVRTISLSLNFKIPSCHHDRPTGTRRSSTAGSTGCTWPASTARTSSGSSRITFRASVSKSRFLRLFCWSD